jgi:hypothetical protein
MKLKKNALALALLTIATSLGSFLPASADELSTMSRPRPSRTVSFNGVVAGDAGLACSLFKVSIVERIQVGGYKNYPKFKDTVLAEGVATGVATNQPPGYCRYNLSFAQPASIPLAEPSATYWQNRTMSVLLDGGKDFAGKYSYQPQGAIPDVLTIDIQAYKR